MNLTKRDIIYGILLVHPEITNAQLAAAAGTTKNSAATYRANFKRDNANA